MFQSGHKGSNWNETWRRGSMGIDAGTLYIFGGLGHKTNRARIVEKWPFLGFFDISKFSEIV